MAVDPRYVELGIFDTALAEAAVRLARPARAIGCAGQTVWIASLGQVLCGRILSSYFANARGIPLLGGDRHEPGEWMVRRKPLGWLPLPPAGLAEREARAALLSKAARVAIWDHGLFPISRLSIGQGLIRATGHDPQGAMAVVAFTVGTAAARAPRG